MHVWALSEGEKAVMVHLVTNGTNDKAVHKTAIEICQQFHMKFFTVQLENKGNICPLGLGI